MDNIVSVTPSLMLEYLYCPRFVYFMKALNIPQNEDSRFKVIEGRRIHVKRALQSKDYKRLRLGVIDKKVGLSLYSDKLRIHGKLDEILFLNDQTAAPLDYKFAEYNGKIYKGYKTQLLMYGLLIEDNFHIEVNRGYLVYTRSKNHVEEIFLERKDYKNIQVYIDYILNIIETGYFPKRAKARSKCFDCCYRNICVK